MSTLETQYKNYKMANPDSGFTFDEWKANYVDIYGMREAMEKLFQSRDESEGVKHLGYVIYHFWDMQVTHLDGEKETLVSQPHLTYRKRIYSDLQSAEEAVAQMKTPDTSNTDYFIMPIVTRKGEYDRMIEAWKRRKEEHDKKA